MNKVILVGRLTKDPDIKYVGANNNTAVAKFSIAVDRRFKKEGEPDADFPNCTAFGKTAEFIDKYFHKGSRIGLEGRIQTGKYEKDGAMVYTTDVVVENVEFVENKNSQPNVAAPGVDADGFMNIPDIDDDELPFN